MQDRKLTPDIDHVIKLAHAQNILYSWISGSYAGLNSGRIAEVVRGRMLPEMPMASNFPSDFPKP